MKINREHGNKVRVDLVEKGSVFYYRDQYWMRLCALGTAQDSIIANSFKTHIADLSNGNIILIPDDVEVTVMDAECVIREVKEEAPDEVDC